MTITRKQIAKKLNININIINLILNGDYKTLEIEHKMQRDCIYDMFNTIEKLENEK
jgi:hypothetical protein